MPEVTIREVRIKDARDIAQLSSELGYPTSPEEVRCRIGQMGESSQNAVFVAVTSDDRIIGWVNVFQTMRLTSETFA